MLPQQFVPTKLPLGGAEEAWYWMVICLWMRGGVNSTDAAKQLSILYTHLATRRCLNPFIVKDAAKLKTKRIVELLTTVNLGMHQAAPAWIENARRLSEGWDGNVLNLYEGVTQFDTIAERLLQRNGDGFAGFQYKMVSMLTYFLTDAGLIKPFDFPPPVDFHLMRLPIATGILRRQDGNLLIACSANEFEDVQSILRSVYLNYQVDHGLASTRFTDALWIHSRSLCRFNPGNRTLQIGGYNARSTLQQAYEPNWTNPTDIRAFEKSCGSCPVRAKCDANVPAGPRYRLGKLEISGRRTEPPTQPLFSPYLPITN